MQRRQVLAALGVLLSAGCLGAKRPDSPSSGVRTEGGRPPETLTSTPQSTATPEPTPESTATPEPTETPEPESSDADVDAGDEAIERVHSAFTTAVEAYTGSDDGTLAAVSLTSSAFDVRSVLLALDTVQSELVAAANAAVTDDQHDTVSDLREAERFLTQSALVHSYFAESVDHLDTAPTAFSKDVDDAETVENRFDTALDRGSAGLSVIKNDLDSATVAVAEPFDDSTYDETVSVFETVRAALKDVSSGMDRLLQGLDELEDAREEEDDGNDDEAAEKADEARGLFNEAYELFDDALDTVDDVAADGFESNLDALQSVADEWYFDAQSLYEDVS